MNEYDMSDNSGNQQRIDRLIAFFKTLRGRSSRPREADYSRWNQTEEAYQQEQAEWLASVRRKKELKGREKNNADQERD